jgi:hypothetical protein
MIVSPPKYLTVWAAAALSITTSCVETSQQTSDNVVLKGFSDSNYDRIDAHISKEVCLTGPLSVNDNGVYFALQPREKDGVIDPGFSRIQTDLGQDPARRSSLSDGKIRTLCGTLVESTLVQNCSVKFCKWYKLLNARERKK